MDRPFRFWSAFRAASASRGYVVQAPTISAQRITRTASERRRYPRVKRLLPVTLETSRGIYRGQVDNLSLGGCSIVTEAACLVGETVTIDLHPPHWRAFSMTGAVMRRNASGIGVQLAVASQEQIIPFLFASRFGPRAAQWHKDLYMMPLLRLTLYLVGIPVAVGPTHLRELLTHNCPINSIAVSYLPEGAIATVHLPAGASELRAVFHGLELNGIRVFAIGADTATGGLLRYVLQAHAEGELMRAAWGAGLQ